MEHQGAKESPAITGYQGMSYPFTQQREVHSERDVEKGPGVRHAHAEPCALQLPEQPFCPALKHSDDSGPWREAQGLGVVGRGGSFWGCYYNAQVRL